MAALWIRYSVGGGPVRINIDGMSDVMDLVQYLCTTQPKLKGVDASDVIVHSPDNVTKYRLSQTLNELIALSTEDHPLRVRFTPPQQYGPLSTGMSSNNALHPSSEPLVNSSGPPALALSQPQLARPDYKVLLNADPLSAQEVGDWLIYDQKILTTAHQKIYIRPCYREIADSIIKRHVGENERKHAIVTGTPGIGKSLFMFYLLRRLVADGQPVMFLYDASIMFYDGRGGVFKVDPILLPSWVDEKLWNPGVWCLLDCKYVTNIDPRYVLCSLIISMSPRRGLVNDFKKESPPPLWLYMPLWSEVEMALLAAEVYPTVTNWRERAKILGYIPRYVLESTAVDARQMISNAANECNFGCCIRAVGQYQRVNENSDVAHRLVHITSVSPFVDYSVTFASSVARDEIVWFNGLLGKQKLETLLQRYSGNSVFGALCGYIFEPYAMDQLQSGGKFKFRELVHGNVKQKPTECDLTILPSNRLIVEKVEVGQKLNQLYVPRSSNYAAIDAWIPGVGGFQMTVGKKHDIKGTAADELKLLGDDADKLYWVLPPLHYTHFTKKTPHSIKQYAICIPYPET